MAEDQKDTQKEFKSFCEGIPFADMMRKMMDAKKSGSPFNCAEMMREMMTQSSRAQEEPEENKEEESHVKDKR
jgi:hypothetical protein